MKAWVVVPVAVRNRIVTRISAPSILARASILVASVTLAIGVRGTRVVMPLAVRDNDVAVRAPQSVLATFACGPFPIRTALTTELCLPTADTFATVHARIRVPVAIRHRP